MTQFNNNMDIREDEIRILGGSGRTSPVRKMQWYHWLAIVLGIAAIAGIILWLCFAKPWDRQDYDSVEGLYEQDTTEVSEAIRTPFVSIEDTRINHINVRLYVPHNTIPEIVTGPQDMNDSSIVFIAQAADVRADNKQILGDFVLNGEKLSYGHSKWGWCSLINGIFSIGCDKDPQSLNKAIDEGGCFFRQYGLVKDGRYVKDTNNKKYQSTRRALCLKDGEYFFVETLDKVSLTDFAYALESYNVDYALALVGSAAYGFAIDESGLRHEFGDITRNLILDTTSYIVLR